MPTQTLVIPAGQSAVLPPGAVITSMLYDGEVTAESTCDNLPDPENYKCGYFQFFIDADDNDGHSMDMGTKYYSVMIGSTTYTLDELVASGDGNSPTLTDIVYLNAHVTQPALFQFMEITSNELVSRMSVHVYFKVPESLFNDTWLVIDNRGVGSLMYLKGTEETCGNYPVPA